MNLINKRFHLLKVVRETEPFVLPSGQKNRAVICLCDCGQEKKVRVLHLIRNKVVSCGCTLNRKGIYIKKSEDKRIRKLWRAIKYRCEKNYIDKHIYYDRGIRVCKEWLSDYYAFQEWALLNGYSPDLQIDRIDNNRGYEPENCRFVTASVNVRNRRKSVIVTYNKETLNFYSFIDKYAPHISKTTAYARFKKGWTLNEIIEIPLVRHGMNRYGKSTKSK